ncbi:DNA-nicking Smr family endonuclease [Neisseria sp. HSC-16F19]|nr:Smr/MutS family protein [Neisseria sp. HSC-16F19]MCP2041372.1 DNA-nicking Smr family endonuclease [Neisseria sp. HSC-16F19]
MSDFHKTLKQLGQAAKAEQAAAAEKAAQAKRQAEESFDFAQAVGSVTPLKNRNQYSHPRDTSPIRKRPQSEDADEGGGFYVGDAFGQDVPATFSKNGRGEHDIRRLQARHWPIVASVDLHGHTREEAQQILNQFVRYVQNRGVCGEIVHGSGLGSHGFTPVLKTVVRRWLMAHPEVLAYAEPHKNNDGAVRVLFKQKKRRDGED